MAAPAPADRRTFLEFQARNRRATWKLGAACALVVGGGGLLAALGFAAGLLLIVFALCFVPAVLLLGLGALALLVPGAGGLSRLLWDGASAVMNGFDLVSALWDGGGSLRGLAVLLFPLGAWLAVRAVWLAAGVGEVLLALQARPPHDGDLEERQLVNVVHEMAVAAGIPPLEVRLLDGAAANAAAVGAGGGPAYVVLGRQLLDRLDRDQTQGLLAHLVGSIGNGDLRGAAHIHALLYVLELMIVVVLSPFARLPRRIALRWLAYPVWAWGRAEAARAERARALIADLGRHRAQAREGGDDPGARLGPDYLGPVGRVLIRVCPPLMALLLFSQAATGFLLLFASVPVALLWRSRRYLADATAVQLTRHPDGLHGALSRLAEAGGAAPGGEGVAHLFVIAPPPARGRSPFWEREGLLMGMHPALARRLSRLARMGAAQARATSGT